MSEIYLFLSWILFRQRLFTSERRAEELLMENTEVQSKLVERDDEITRLHQVIILPISTQRILREMDYGCCWPFALPCLAERGDAAKLMN